MDCLLSIKRLKLDIEDEKAQQVFIIYQLLLSLDYAALIKSTKDMDDQIKAEFTPANYINKLKSLCSKSDDTHKASFFKYAIDKQHPLYQIIKNILQFLRDRKGAIVSDETVNIVTFQPQELVSIFGNALNCIAEDLHYRDKKQLITNMVSVTNRGTTYLSRFPCEILRYTAIIGMSDHLSHEKQKEVVDDCFAKLSC